MNQYEPNLATIILRVSSLRFVSDRYDVPVDQPIWLPFLKVEHRDKINKKNQLKNPEVELLPNFIEIIHL